MPPRGSERSIASAYVLDSFAVMAYLQNEPGHERVTGLLEAAANNECALYLSVVNLGEIAYHAERAGGLSRAAETMRILDELPVSMVSVDRELALAAAHLKAQYPMAYADCFAAALSQIRNAPLVTGDPEFRKLSDGLLHVEWLPVADE